MAVAFVAVVVVPGLLLARSYVAARDRSHVHVLAEADAMTCEGTRVEHRSPASGNPSVPEMPLVPVERDMRCDYTFTVSNQGSARVRLERMEFPFLGPGGGPPVEAAALDPGGIRPNRSETIDSLVVAPVEAIFELDVDLEPDGEQTFTLRIVYRPDGCLSAGGTIWFKGAPTLTLRSRGVTGERAAETAGIAFLGHPVLNCDGP